MRYRYFKLLMLIHRFFTWLGYRCVGVAGGVRRHSARVMGVPDHEEDTVVDTFRRHGLL